MATARHFYKHPSETSATPPQKDWPTMYDLPSEYPEEDGLPDEFHLFQPQLLSETWCLTTVVKDQVFTGSDLNLYYDRNNKLWHKRPDWFAVAGVPRFYDGEDLRLSYVVWDEQAIPFVIVELLSPKTAKSDLGEDESEPDGTPTKWQVYEQILKVPHYVVFDRIDNNLWVYKLVDGQYQKQNVRDCRYWLEDMAIGLGVWEGEFKGNTRLWLRWYGADEVWIPTEGEQLQSESSRAEVEAQQAESERQRREEAEKRAEAEVQQRKKAESEAERLRERLRSLGIDSDEM